jgi:methyl-accepting chemotaxis protein
MSRFFTQAYARIGIVTPLLVGYMLAALIAIAMVQAWTLHLVGQSEYRSAQSRLDTDMAVLRLALGHLGTDWHLGDDGRLMLGERTADGLDALVEDVARITHDQVTVFAGDTRTATTVRRPDGSRPVGTRLAAGPARDTVIGRGQAYRAVTNILGVAYFTAYEPLLDAAGRQLGIVFVGVRCAQMQTASGSILVQSTASGLFGMLVVVTIGWLLLRAIFRPLQAVAGAVDAIGDGGFDIAVPFTNHAGPFGAIGRAVETLRDKAQRARAVETGAAADRADKLRRQDAMDRLIQDFGTSISGVLSDLVRSVGAMRIASGEMAHAAGRARSEIASTMAATQKSAANLSQLLSEAEALTDNARGIARQVDATAQSARQAQAQASDATMRNLDHAAGEINQALNLLGDITGQANKLALAATAEATRAGDATALANEVKQFATRTGEATWRIGLQVAAIQGATGEAAEAVRSAAGTIEQAGETANAIAIAVEQHSAASHAIAAVVQAGAQAMDAAIHAMKAATHAAARSGDASQTVLLAADDVTKISGSLREEVDHFVTAMRTSQQGGKRRKYERIPGHDTAVRLWTAKLGPASASIIDISLGGAALACDWPCEPGTEILVDLPGVGVPVSSRVINARGDVLAVAFRQDPETLTRVGQAIDRINAKASGTKAKGVKAA